MKGFFAFGALLAVILLGLGIWTATEQGGGGLGDEGGAGRDRPEQQDGDPGVVAEDRGSDEPVQDDSEGRVEIRDGKFSPSTVEVPVRSVVTFINRDDVARRIDFEDDQLEDAEIAAGASHTLEVTEAGRYSFTGNGDGEPSGDLVVRE